MIQKINQKIGILGGGQLGKMLCQAGSKLGLSLHVMDKDESFPAYKVCADYTCGDITSYEDVMAFGKDLDIITIEIEHVNIKALEDLEKAGKKVYPSPAALNIIKDKGKQKIFYEGMGFPTSEFSVFEDVSGLNKAIENGELTYPFVQKLRTEGYDGRGVQVIRSAADELFENGSIIESLVDIEKEIAVIVARNPSEQLVVYPIVEMHFHPTANLVEYLFSPSTLCIEQQNKATIIAANIAEKLDVIGLLAVEMFIDCNGEILVNEVAPRPHNSGHHTIEACLTSQFEMHLRAILDLPLSGTQQILPAVMMNLLGEDSYSGDAIYTDLDQFLAMPGVNIHIYGKEKTKPFRKMGHVTIVDSTVEQAVQKSLMIKSKLKVIA